MSVVIRAVQLEGFAIMSLGDTASGWLEFYDPNAHDGWGEVLFTNDINRAMRFNTIAEAFEVWKRPSTVRPQRPDGEPNRPLTAFTITLENVEG